jgi:hypothetical protein
MLVAVQGLWIIAASVTLRLRRPQAAGAPARSYGSEEARPGHEQNEHRDLRRRGQPASPPGRSQLSAGLLRSVTAVRCDLARPAAVISSPSFGVFAVNTAGPGPRRGHVIYSSVLHVPEVM